MGHFSPLFPEPRSVLRGVSQVEEHGTRRPMAGDPCDMVATTVWGFRRGELEGLPLEGMCGGLQGP